MIKLLSVAIVAGLVLGADLRTPVKNRRRVAACWTGWFDSDDPSGHGDWETLSYLRKKNPGKICPIPAAIEARTLSDHSVASAGDVIYLYNPTKGFVCRNKDQECGGCRDYKVRFGCPCKY